MTVEEIMQILLKRHEEIKQQPKDPDFDWSDETRDMEGDTK